MQITQFRAFSSFFAGLVGSLVVVFLTGKVRAQNIQQWGENEQLASRSVSHGMQDKQGFLWFATDNGLSRFDGYSFVSFRTSNLQGLPSNKIVSLCEDLHGNMWIGTQEGIGILNTKTYKIIRVLKHSSHSASLASNGICEIIKDANNRIWVSTQEGQLHQYLGKGRFKRISNPFQKDGLFGNHPNITSYKHTIYLASIQRGVFEINLHHCVKAHPEKKFEPHNGIISSVPGLGVIVAAKEGFYTIDAKSGKLRPTLRMFGEQTYMVRKDHSGDLWAIQQDRKQLWQYNKETHRLEEWTDLVFNAYDNVHMTYLFEDSSNNLWICTNKGVYKLSNKRRTFHSILRLDQYNVPNYIPSYRGMLEDPDGTIFIGGYSGLFRLEKNGHINRLFSNEIPYTPYLLEQKNRNELWAMCEGYGIITVHKKTGKVTQYPDPFAIAEDYKGIYIKSGVLARDRKFWLGTYSGVIRFDPRTEKYYKQRLRYGKFDLTNDFLVTQIIQDKEGNLWMSSNEGIFVFTEKGKPLHHYHESAKAPYKIPFNDVKCMLTDSKKRHWFGSASEGIICLDGKKVRHITTKNRLSDNGIAGMLEDLEGNIWITTNKGISVYISETGKIKTFYQEDGLSDNEFNHGSLLQTKKGKLYFGGINGINSYNPRFSNVGTSRKGRLSVSYVEIPTENNSKRLFYNDLFIRKGVRLNPNMGHLYLEFFVNDFVRSEKNSFEYMLKGYDKRWQSIGQQNHIRFTGLAPGDYVLKIRATNSKGVPASNQLMIPLIVDQVFYKTWWFSGLLLLGFISFVWYLYYVRVKRLKMVIELRTTIASDIHDNLGSSLTTIAMESEILEEGTTSEQKEMFRKIAQSCRSAIASMRDMVWSIDERNTSAKNLMDRCNEHANQILGLAKIPCYLEIDQQLHDLKLNPLERQETFIIFKETIVNAIKHGDGKGVTIRMRKEKKQFVLSVFNGTIVTVDQEKAGLGLKNILRRAKKIGAEVSFLTDDGFEVKLVLPIRGKFAIFG